MTIKMYYRVCLKFKSPFSLHQNNQKSSTDFFFTPQYDNVPFDDKIPSP